MLLLFAVAWRAESWSPRLHPETLCRTDEPLKTHTVVLVDRTDSVSAAQAEYLLEDVRTLGPELAKGAMLSVIPIEDTGMHVGEPVFSLCSPGKAEDYWFVTHNVRKMQRRFEREFEKPLAEVLDQFRTASTAPRSPILETIRAVSRRPDFSSEVPHRRLVIISDMLENVDEFSHYAHPYSFDTVRHNGYYASVQADLAGVEVRVLYVDRPGQHRHQGPRHVQFWRDYFRDSGAVPRFELR